MSNWGRVGPAWHSTGMQPGWGTPNNPVRPEVARIVRRSSLIMPVNVPRFIEKAHLRGADAIVLDLEDSIPMAEKAAARKLVREAVPLVARGGADVLVRINKPFDLAVADLDAVVWPGVKGIKFPKAESAEEIRILDALLTEREQARGLPLGSIQIAVGIETALGLYNALDIATASPRIVSISLGAEDFTRDLGVEPSPDGQELAWGKGMIVIVARLAGIQAHGLPVSIANYGDPEAFARHVQAAAQMGFVGASCIHPSQVPALNRYFSPSPEAVAHAREVIRVYEEAERTGRASVGLNDSMVDVPVVERARRLLERAETIAAWEAHKAEALARL